MQINVRRNSLTVDSLNAIMTMKRRDLRKYWKFCFLGEIGLDAGGLTREWFKLGECLQQREPRSPHFLLFVLIISFLVTEELFDSNIGLFQSSAVNQQCLQINPMSGT
jgi:E3 ubiquitin-protein ligase NEDD4